MFQFAKPSQGTSRRQWLQATSMGTLALAGLCAENSDASDSQVSPLAERKPQFLAKAKRVIHLFMNGGPSQVDLIDPKPTLNRLDGEPLPDSVRKKLQRTQLNRVANIFGSPFRFSKHGNSGLPFSELLPSIAQHADDICVIRSMQGEIANHTPGLLLTNCGHSALPRPCIGSWALYGLGSECQDLPGFVVLCPGGLPTAQSRNWTSAFMPGIYQGTHIDISSNEKELVPNLTRDIAPSRQRAQVELTQFLNRTHQASRAADERLESRIQSMELAFRMQAAGTDAFDLSQEPEYIRARYGDHKQGRNLLIARRLAERGVRYIQCYHGDRQPWDSHGSIVKNIKRLSAESDAPIGALLTDLKERGMLDETLVIWGGEMGRTPTVQQTKNPAIAGRDHHIDGYSIWMAGGGIRGGMHYGATDELAMSVVENPVKLHDFHATILHLLGFDHKRLTYRYSSRDYRLTDVHGKVIHDILA